MRRVIDRILWAVQWLVLPAAAACLVFYAGYNYALNSQQPTAQSSDVQLIEPAKYSPWFMEVRT